MNISRLQLANLRAFEQAEFQFTLGMNLLVGINGVGKTTVLDAMRICLSKILPDVTASRSRPLALTDEDIRIDSSSATIQLSFNLVAKPFEFLLHKQRDAVVPHKPGEVREETLDTPDRESYTPALATLGGTTRSAEKQPVCVFFSTRRSLPSEVTPSSFSASGGQAGAFTDALINSRELRLLEIAYWMRAQEAIASEEPRAAKHLVAMRRAAKRFLPECRNLRVEESEKPSLVIDKIGQTLNVRQLSDGERGMLALVLDLSRRLSQANPGLSDPVKSGLGVVLIDELELHLHPQWQRNIVDRLTTTFPHCQFIATTHSPQVFGEVERERIQIISRGQVHRPRHSFGLDSSRVLEEEMGTKPRTPEVYELLSNLSRAIGDEKYKHARKLLIELSAKVGDDDPEVTHASTLMEFMEEKIESYY